MPNEKLNRPRRKTSDSSGDVLDAFEAAWLIGAHVETLRRLARKGKVPAYKVGKDWRFSRTALERWRDANQTRGEPPLALVVDDEAGILATVELTLTDAGYRVHTAPDGAEALALARRELPDVLILDLSMPGVSGVTVLKEICALDPSVPVIILTGYPDGTLMHEALQQSSLLVVAKPAKPEELLRAVDKTLGRGS